jgi:hypothetical protein
MNCFLQLFSLINPLNSPGFSAANQQLGPFATWSALGPGRRDGKHVEWFRFQHCFFAHLDWFWFKTCICMCIYIYICIFVLIYIYICLCLPYIYITWVVCPWDIFIWVTHRHSQECFNMPFYLIHLDELPGQGLQSILKRTMAGCERGWLGDPSLDSSAVFVMDDVSLSKKCLFCNEFCRYPCHRYIWCVWDAWWLDWLYCMNHQADDTFVFVGVFS